MISGYSSNALLLHSLCMRLFGSKECTAQFEGLCSRLFEVLDGQHYDEVCPDEFIFACQLAVLFHWKAKTHPFRRSGVMSYLCFLQLPRHIQAIARLTLAEEVKNGCIKI